LYLEQKEDPLPQYMIDILEQLTTNVTYKTILERQMAEYHAGKVQAAQDIIRSIAFESVLDVTDYRNWLSNLESLEADKQIVSSYLSEGEYSSATSLLNIMASIYELEGDRLQEFNDYKDLMLMQIFWRQQARNVFQLDNSEMALIQDYADNSSGHSQAIARGILSQLNNIHYCECLYSNGNIPMKSQNTSNMSSFRSLAGTQVTVEPNPAHTWAAFNFRLKGTNPTATLQVMDATGKILHTKVLTGNEGQYVWDLRDVKVGVYFYTINSSGIIESGKLIVR